MYLNLGLNKLKTISFGLVLIFFQLFLFINTSVLFPNDTAYWNKVIGIYLIISAVFFALPNVRSKLFDIKFIAVLPRYLVAFALTYFFLWTFGDFFVNATFASYINGLSIISLGAVIFHSCIVAFVEESIFRGEMAQKHLGLLASSVLFAIFHYGVYGYSVAYMLLMFVLGLIFYTICIMFSPKDGIVNSAVHGAYNVISLGVKL